MKTKAKEDTPYGKTVVLKDDAAGVECWNFTDNSRHRLPKGTRLLLEHVHDETHTTCMLVDEEGNHPGILLFKENGMDMQRGYRFILPNEQLNRLADAGLPAKAFDVVGAIMAYEQGGLDEAATLDLFRRLKEDGTLFSLQGHYQREARRLGVI